MTQAIPRDGTVDPPNGAGVASVPAIPAVAPIRRALFFGKSMSRTRCSRALIEALGKLGVEVTWMNRARLRRWLGSRLADRWIQHRFRALAPDLVFVWWRDLPLDLLRQFKTRALTVSWVEEALLAFPPSEAEYLSTPHLVASSNLAAIARLRELGVANTTFLMSGFSPTYHHALAPAAMQRDVGYIGGPGVGGGRARLLQTLAQECDVEAFTVGFGDWSSTCPSLRLNGPVGPTGYRRICATSRIVLGINEVNDIPFHFSNRTFLVLACGGFHLTRYVPGLEEIFSDGEHLAWFESEAECLDKVRFYLGREDLRRRIAQAGHDLVHRRHRYVDRVRRILDILECGFEVDHETSQWLHKARMLAGPKDLALAVGACS